MVERVGVLREHDTHVNGGREAGRDEEAVEETAELARGGRESLDAEDGAAAQRRNDAEGDLGPQLTVISIRVSFPTT